MQRQVEKNKERLKLEQGDDKVKDSHIMRLIDMERQVTSGSTSDRLLPLPNPASPPLSLPPPTREC